MTLIDGDKIVTAQSYDDEHEEFTEKKMSIIDFVNAYTDEGVTVADDVLNKIREQIKSNLRGVEIALEVLVETHPLRPKMEGAKDTLEDCLEIIDKAETEAEDGNVTE